MTTAQVPGLTRTDLQRHDLSPPGREVIQNRVEIAPDAPRPATCIRARRSSTCSKGRWSTSSTAGPRRFQAGEVLTVPPEPVHSAKNVGSRNGTELATYIVEKGKPLLVLVDLRRRQTNAGSTP